jgi:hypothetical protein
LVLFAVSSIAERVDAELHNVVGQPQRIERAAACGDGLRILAGVARAHGLDAELCELAQTARLRALTAEHRPTVKQAVGVALGRLGRGRGSRLADLLGRRCGGASGGRRGELREDVRLGAAPHERAHHARGALRTENRGRAVIVKRVHLLLHDLRVSAQRRAEHVRVLEDGRADFCGEAIA